LTYLAPEREELYQARKWKTYETKYNCQAGDYVIHDSLVNSGRRTGFTSTGRKGVNYQERQTLCKMQWF
jgi:hypothetical protein